jgi:osmotically inducible protein OsmC
MRLTYLAETKNLKFMMRYATAHWEGTGKEGKGDLTTQSNLLSKAPYSYVTRFENATGTNPEELVAAAHAGCFTMKLSFVLVAAGFTATSIDTKCEITLDSGSITSSKLTVNAKVPNIDKAKFDAAVADAKANCPISKLYNTTITAEATLS